MNGHRIYTLSERRRAIWQVAALVFFALIGLQLCVMTFTVCVISAVASELPMSVYLRCLMSKCQVLARCTALTALQEYATYILGYLFAIAVGHFSIGLIMETAWKCTKSLDGSDVWQPRILGCLETVLYLAAFTAGGAAYTIIPAWLVFKVAGAWRRGRSEKDSDKRLINNNFLIGTLLCLIYGALGAFFGKYLHNRTLDVQVFVFGSMLFAASGSTLLLWLYLDRLSRRANIKNWKKLKDDWGRMATLRTRHVRDILGEPDNVERLYATRLIWHYHLLDGQHGQILLDGSDVSGYRVIDMMLR